MRSRGTVRISASEVIGVEVLPPIPRRIAQGLPDLSVELSASMSSKTLLRQEADIAVRLVAQPRRHWLRAISGAVPLGFHAHSSYLERRGIPQTLEDLSRHSVIGYTGKAGDPLDQRRAPDLPMALRFQIR